MHFFSEDRLSGALMAQLNVLLLYVLLDNLHDTVVFKCGLQLVVAPFFAQTLNKLGLDEH